MKTIAITLIAAMSLGFAQNAQAHTVRFGPIVTIPAAGISKSERVTLNKMERNLKRYKVKARADGRLTYWERVTIKKMQRQLNTRTRVYRASAG